MDFNINVNANSSRLNHHHHLEVNIEELQLDDDIDFTLCCRLCIQNKGSIEFLTSKTLCEQIKMFTNIDLEYNAENYPKSICENCNQLLNDFHVYQQNCLQINQRLTDLLISKNDNKTSLASTYLENMKLPILSINNNYNNDETHEEEPESEPIQIDTEQKFNFILMEYGESHSKFNDILKDNDEISSDNVLKLLLNDDKDLNTIEDNDIDNENDIEEYQIEYLNYSDLEENDNTRSGSSHAIEMDDDEENTKSDDDVDDDKQKKLMIDIKSKSDNDHDNEIIQEENRSCKDIQYYICPECNKFYTQKRSLKRHVLSAHPDKADCWRPVKAFKSCLCIAGRRKGFHDKHDLKAHVLSTAQHPEKGPHANEYHMNDKNIGPGYVCTECGNSYTEVRSLKRHAISKHPDIPNIWKQAKIALMAKRCRQSIQQNRRDLNDTFYCSDCGNTYLYFTSLRRHAFQSHGIKLTASDSEKMKLKLVDKVDKDNNNKVEGQEEVDEDNNNDKIKLLYDCKLCGRILYEKHCLKRHLQLKHPDAITMNDYNNDDDAYNNINSHTQQTSLLSGPKYTCDIDKLNCNATFSNKENYQRHKSKEHNFKEYLCYTCGKAFTNIKNLESHETFHLNIMPYKCMKCDQRFRFTANLKTHFKKHHEGHRYYCTKCGKAFLSNCTRKRHELIHDGIKDFKCDQCVAEFYTLKELKCHQRYHNDIRPHFCNICYKSFVAKTVLRIHMRSHTGEKPFQCDFNQCNKRFAEKTKLYRHQRNVHHLNPTLITK